MSFSTLLRISRPRFWHYVLWPMLIYFASSWYFEDIQESFSRWWTDRIFNLIIMIIILWYFTLPANLWIYGRNDIADWDTDKFNSKKWSYEAKIDDSKTMKNKLKQSIWLWNIGYLSFWFFTIIGITVFKQLMNIENTDDISSFFIYLSNLLWQLRWSSHSIRWRGGETIIVMLVSFIIFLPTLITSYLYSCRPLRAKAKPFIDGIMNILYIATPFSIIIWQYIFWADPTYNLQLITYNFLAALFRCMAMHCYSAIPDIEPDHQAWLTTTAVYLGKQNALIYCAVLYMLSALLSFPTLWWFSIIWWMMYMSVMVISYYKKDIFALYKLFPYINLFIGFLLFRYIIFH